tara:strand:- start:3910 stop:5199 length:1290 start_codon:yes stop_codon:yes gene_type:complete
MSSEKDIHIIGQGTYGCVYRPNIDCKTNEIGSRKYLSKIQQKDKTSKNELKLGKKIIKSLPKPVYNSRFAPILESCPINIGKMEKDQFSTCKMIVQENNAITKTGLISNKLMYVGKLTLGSYLESELINKNKTLQNAILYCKKLAETHIYLLESIEILNNINIIHLDMKYNNVMFDDIRGVPIIIDFGLSYNSKYLDINRYVKQKETFGIAVPFYLPWPIEVIMLSYLANELKTNSRHIDEEKLKTQFDKITMFKEICSQYVKKNILLQNSEIFKKDEKEHYTKMLHNWVESWKGTTWRDVWTILSNNHKSWDNYSLCIMYLMELQISGLQLISNVNDEKENNFLKKYIVVLKKEILSKPTERSNAGITRKELHNVFSQANKIEYKRVLQKFSLLIKDNKAKIKKDRISHNMKTLQEEKIVHEKYNARV